MRKSGAAIEIDRRAAPVAALLLAHLLRDFACDIGHDGALLRGIAGEAGEAAAGAFESALAAEAMTHPALVRESPELAGELAACLMAMAEGGTLIRAMGRLPLMVASDDPERLDIRTATHEFFGNLRQGVLRQRMRGTSGPGIQHGGAMIEIRLWGRSHCLDVEDAIVEVQVTTTPGVVRLTQVSAIAAPGRFGGTPRAVGRLSYTYEIRAASPWLGVTARFDLAPGVAPRRLRLITACDGISDGGAFTEVRVDGVVADLTPGMVTLREGPVAAITLRQLGASSMRLEVRPVAPGDVMNAKLSVREDAAAHWLVLRHAPGSIAADRVATAPSGARMTNWPADAAMAIDTTKAEAAFSVAEERLLLDSDAAALPTSQRGRGLGQARGRSIALLAVARRLAHAEDTLAPMAAAERAALRGFVATLMAELHAAPALVALDAGFLVLAEQVLGEPPSRDRLLALEQRESLGGGLERGLYGTAADQAAAIMGLAALGEAAALTRALAALGVVSVAVELQGRRAMAELPAVAGIAAEDTLSLALLLRALVAVALARGAGTLALDASTAARAARLEALYTSLLEARLHGDGDGIAVADSALGGPASGVGQAATLAALAGRG
jgi:hypothetical protein